MAIKIELKKNDETKNGFVAFSFTTFLWGAFVPIFRGDGKGFVKLFFIWLVTSGLVIFLEKFPYDSIDFDKIPSIRDFIVSLLNVKYKYIFLASYCFYSLLSLISFVIWIFIAKNYNRDYTNKLLNQGYMPSEDDNYSLALLKEYGHLEYTKDELKDNEKMEQYCRYCKTRWKKEILYISSVYYYNLSYSCSSSLSYIYKNRR